MMHKRYVLSSNDIYFKEEEGLYVMECPLCGKYWASASPAEREYMPEMNICYGHPTHEEWREYKKERQLTNADIAGILGITADSVKNQTQPNKELPRWAIAMLYEWNKSKL